MGVETNASACEPKHIFLGIEITQNFPHLVLHMAVLLLYVHQYSWLDLHEIFTIRMYRQGIPQEYISFS